MDPKEKYENTLIKIVVTKHQSPVFETSNAVRSVHIISESVKKNADIDIIYTWSLSKGMCNDHNKPIGHNGDKQNHSPFDAIDYINNFDTTGMKCMFILLDYDIFLDDAGIIWKVSDMLNKLQYTDKLVAFHSKQFEIPMGLSTQLVHCELPIPDEQEIDSILCNLIEDSKLYCADIETKIRQKSTTWCKINGDIKDIEPLKEQLAIAAQKHERITQLYKTSANTLIRSGWGLSRDEFIEVITRCIDTDGFNPHEILEEKKRILNTKSYEK